MTAPFIGALQADLRFRAAPLELRGVYRMLTDYQDAAGDVAAPGLSGVEACAIALGCAPGEAAPLLQRLQGLGLLQVEPARVRLLVGSPRGSRGGMSDAERKRLQRSRSVTGRVTGNVTDGVTDSVTGQAAVNASDSSIGHGPVTGAVTVESRVDVTACVTGQVTAPVVTSNENTAIPVVSASTANIAAPVAEAPGGSPSGLPSSLPHTPSLTPLPTSPSDHAVPGGSASPGDPANPAPPSETTRKPPRPDTDEPLPGTPAAEALGALRSTRLLLPIVVRPCELAETITAGAFPALDVPREIAAAEAWLVGNPANAKRNGARYLINWLKQAQERAPRVDPRQSGEFTRPGPRPAPEADPGAAIRDAAWAEWERKMRAAGKEIPR